MRTYLETRAYLESYRLYNAVVRKMELVSKVYKVGLKFIIWMTRTEAGGRSSIN